MTPIKYHLCNDILRRPEGVPEEECRDLHIHRSPESVASFWQPSAEELAALAAGQPVLLFIQGHTHPPLSVGVMYIPENQHPTAG